MRPQRFPRRAGIATLRERRALADRVIRVTLHADDFAHEWPRQQPGEIITLLFAPPDERIVLPREGWTFPPDVEPQPWRNYTVRRHRPTRGEIDVDIVLHEPRGPACTWAELAPLGCGVGYAGPRVDFAPHDDADWLLLCGDETAIPAIGAIIESAPERQHVIAVIEVPDAKAEPALDLERERGAEVRWVHRGPAPPATTSHLADALRGLQFPPGEGQAWGAAESRVARDLRTVLRDERGMARARAHARGYWLRKGDWILDDD
jgi:NADPH-dependent ferric siderophore reductase